MKPSDLSEQFNIGLNLCMNTRCNICASACPKYLSNKMEFNSPRGKIELIFEGLQGRIDQKKIFERVSCAKSCNDCYNSCPHELHIPDLFLEFIKVVGTP